MSSNPVLRNELRDQTPTESAAGQELDPSGQLPIPLDIVTDIEIQHARQTHPRLMGQRPNDIRQALLAPSYLMRPMHGYGDVDGNPPDTPTAAHVAHFRATLPDLAWMSRGGVVATIIYWQEQERARREELLQIQDTSFVQTPQRANPVPPPPPPPPTPPPPPPPPATIMAVPSPSQRSAFVGEPTDSELEQFRTQCASMVNLSNGHLRSTITYLRDRRRRRQRGDESHLRAMMAGPNQFSVPESTIRERVAALQAAEGPPLARRANFFRMQELQRLLSIEEDKRAGDSRASVAFRGGGDGEPRTIARTLSTGHLDQDPFRDLRESSSELPAAVVATDSADLDRGPRNQASYHDLFEEMHGSLL